MNKLSESSENVTLVPGSQLSGLDLSPVWVAVKAAINDCIPRKIQTAAFLH